MTGRQKISPEELREILAEHEKWLTSDGKEGSRACLRSCDLSGVSLARVQLKGTDLSDADLSRADLSLADLRTANLTGAVLENANLSGAVLFDADLENASLRDVKGLAADRLGGTNLTGAELPPHIAQFRGLEYVTAASRHARITFFTLLLVCAYAVIGIFTTADRELIINGGSFPIPLIAVEVPMVSFYAIMPFLIVAIYAYLLIELGQLWRRLPTLPARFPDGTALSSAVYPWSFNEPVKEFMPQLRLRHGFYHYVMLLFLWFTPLATIIGMWWRYLPRHDPFGTVFHIALAVPAVSVGSVLFMFWHLHVPTDTYRLHLIKERKWIFITATSSLLIFLISAGTFYGDADRFSTCNRAYGNVELCIKKSVPNLLRLVGYRAYADLRGEEISRRPDIGSNEPEFFAAIRGADLEGQDLRYADARGAFFVKAILRSADLQKADLRRADLRLARLINANLEGAHLEDADLKRAVLVGATLKGAFLNRAKLQDANLFNADLSRTRDVARRDTRADLTESILTGARLERANLSGAILQGADLADAKLDGADLRGANLAGTEGLTRSQLKTACGDETTIVPRNLWHYTLEPCSW